MFIVGCDALFFSDVFININVAQLKKKKVLTFTLSIYSFVESSLKPHKNSLFQPFYNEMNSILKGLKLNNFTNHFTEIHSKGAP